MPSSAGYGLLTFSRYLRRAIKIPLGANDERQLIAGTAHHDRLLVRRLESNVLAVEFLKQKSELCQRERNPCAAMRIGSDDVGAVKRTPCKMKIQVGAFLPSQCQQRLNAWCCCAQPRHCRQQLQTVADNRVRRWRRNKTFVGRVTGIEQSRSESESRTFKDIQRARSAEPNSLGTRSLYEAARHDRNPGRHD